MRFVHLLSNDNRVVQIKAMIWINFGLLCPQADEQPQSLLSPTMFITNIRLFASYAMRYIDDRVYSVIGERSGMLKLEIFLHVASALC